MGCLNENYKDWFLSTPFGVLGAEPGDGNEDEDEDLV